MTGVCLLKNRPFHTSSLMAPWCPWAYGALTLLYKNNTITAAFPPLPSPTDATKSTFPLRGFVFVCLRGGGGLKNNNPERLMRCSRSVTCSPGAISLHHLVWRSEASGCELTELQVVPNMDACNRSLDRFLREMYFYIKTLEDCS